MRPAQYVTVPEVARILAVHPKTVRRWIAAGTLQAAQVQAIREWHQSQPKTRRGAWRIPVAEWRRFLREFRAQQGAEAT
jgi:excisionase family DNA binding protein